MLKITIPETEYFNEETQEFVTVKETSLTLEHSLVSISKWESKWHKPFMTQEPKSIDETRDYIRCMTMTQNVDPRVYYCITNEHMEQVNKYIDEPSTATWFGERNGKAGRGYNKRVVTSELVYYWMIQLNIPVEFQKWHFNRLMTLIRVCSEEQEAAQGNHKMSKADILRRNKALNAQRRAKMHSKG